MIHRTTIEPPAPPISPGPPPGDLSTIIEAETSGTFKHIPNQLLEPASGTLATSPRRTQSTSVDTNGLPPVLDPDASFVCDDTSALNLTTSKLTTEVLDAIMVKDVLAANEWLNGVDGVVLDDVGSSPPKTGGFFNGAQDTNLSFNLGSLDPDLAALLSPNKPHTDDQTLFGINPSLATSPPLSARRFEPPPSRGLTRTAPPRSPSPGTFYHAGAHLLPALYPSEAQSSTPARRRSASLSRSNSSQRATSLSALPRLARPAAGTTTPFRQGKELAGSASSSPKTSSEGDDGGRRASGDHLRRRQPPPSPLSSNAQGAGATHSSGEAPSHRQLRLVTPARRAASYSTASSSRPPLRHSTTTGSGPGDNDSKTPSSGASSSGGTATTSKRRLHYPRPNTAEGDADRTLQHRARKRSMSLHRDVGSPGTNFLYQTPAPPTRPSSAMSSRRPTAEWLGPRTAKAFAAAGLLDHEKSGKAGANGSSRHFLMKGGAEQDPRTQYNAPSRMAFSEASGSTSSWGPSRSASRTLTMSEAGGALTESPTYSPTPRTTFSSSSTAPTSISASSSMAQPSLNLAIQSMREKHGIETEALLSALSDSQRTTKMLREENRELRARVQELEGTLNHMRRRSASPQPPAKSLSRMVYQRMSQSSLDNGLSKRPQSHVQTHFLYPNSESIPPSVTPERDPSPNPFKEPPSQGRRLSTTSSNFHVPPNNMSMLMLEADLAQRSEGFSSRSVSPPSPTFNIPKQSSSLRQTHNRSMSSGGNISPMTANFSMTGSPGSLNLRPEHEMHLGDMASLDLAMVGDDSGEDDGL